MNNISTIFTDLLVIAFHFGLQSIKIVKPQADLFSGPLCGLICVVLHVFYTFTVCLNVTVLAMCLSVRHRFHDSANTSVWLKYLFSTFFNV